jgi:hypothetical protein
MLEGITVTQSLLTCLIPLQNMEVGIVKMLLGEYGVLFV